MKKILLVGIVLLNMLSVNAQIDQLTALKKIPEKTIFTEYWGIYKEPDGYTGTAYEATVQMSYKNNVIDKVGSYYLTKDYVGNKKPDPAQPKPDHPTKPALFYSSFTGKGMVIIDSLIYEFERGEKENILNGDFKIESIYEIKPKVEQKKVSFMKALKSQKKSKSGKPICYSKKIAYTDHIKVLKEYFIAMKKIQEEATKNFTPEQKKEIALIKAIEEGDEEARMKLVGEDWAKTHSNNEEGNSNEIIIINNTGHSVCVVQGGSSTSLTSGRNKFSCFNDIYYGVKDGNNCTSTKGTLIVAKDKCGTTITLK